MSSDYADSLEIIEKAQRGETQAVENILRMHQGLIRMLAGRLFCRWTPLEEFLQAGSLGLLHAIEHYDASRGTKLSTYAVPWILGEMRRTMKRSESGVYSLDQQTERDGQSLYNVLCTEGGVDIGQIDLRLAISRLCFEAHNLIIMRYYGDLTQREVALMMGKSQSQISKMERHALDTLHAMLS